MTEEMQRAVGRGIEDALALSETENKQAAVDRLLSLVGEYPYSAVGYQALANVYADLGDGQEAEYNFKQWIALRPDYRNLMLFAKYLGRAGRLAEARAIEEHLWQLRSEVPTDLSLEAVHDYLVTLSRVPDGPKMVEVTSEAMKEYGRETTLVYQQIYGYILAGREVEAWALLNSVLPRLSAEDPLQPRFQQMVDYLRAQLLGG
jgi:tetratricopeptide (TPR) repeat protein